MTSASGAESVEPEAATEVSDERARTPIRPDIEGLRAVSVAMVLGYHFMPAYLPGGYVGVDVFFVISGYLITLSLMRDHADATSAWGWLTGFWARRTRRLLPNALATLLFSLGIGACLLSDSSWRRLGTEAASSALYATNWLFVARATDYLAWDAGQKPWLLHFWSLAVEEQFYLLWPLLLLLVLRAARGRSTLGARFGAGTLFVATIVVTSFALVVWLAPLDPPQAFFSTVTRSWELAAGALLVFVQRELQPRLPGRGTRQAIGLVLIAGGAAQFSETVVHPGWATWMPVLGAVLVIGASRRSGTDFISRSLGCAPMVAAGRRAYSIYLWHWPVLMLGSVALQPEDPMAYAAIALVGLAAAECAYRFVEQPARHRWGLGWSSHRVLALGLTACLGVTALGVATRLAVVQDARRVVTGVIEGHTGLGTLLSGERIAADIPPVYGNGCHLSLTATLQPDCVAGADEGRDTVVAFGDSQAAQWYSAFNAAALQEGSRFYSWTKSSCPAADLVPASRSSEGARSCMHWRDRTLDRIVSLQPRWVLLAGAFDAAGPVIDRAGKTHRSEVDISRAWETALVSVIARLQSAGIEVILLRAMPMPRADALDCLYSTREPGRCERPRSQSLAASAPELRAGERTGARVWDFTAAICGGESCQVVAEGPTLVYRDVFHLTDSFVRSITPTVIEQWSLSARGAN